MGWRIKRNLFNLIGDEDLLNFFILLVVKVGRHFSVYFFCFFLYSSFFLLFSFSKYLILVFTIIINILNKTYIPKGVAFFLII